jgi:RNA polymerase sigma-70 factor (ECF subfamily)
VNEAIARLKIHQRWAEDSLEAEVLEGEAVGATTSNPESEMASREAQSLLEEAILRLPLDYRAVVMLRDVEEMTTAETATVLELTEEAVKVRLHRARAMMRRDLFARVGATSVAAFQFQAPRCDRVAAAVMSRISD